MNEARAEHVGQLFLAVDPTLSPLALALALSVSQLETGLGTSYFNYGSGYDAKDSPPCEPPNHEVTDTDVNGKEYNGCLKGATNDLDGARFFLRTLMKPNVIKALKDGSIKKAVWAMRDNTYFVLDRAKYLERVNVHIDQAKTVANRLVKASRVPSKGYNLGTPLALGALGLIAFLVYRASEETETEEEETDSEEKEEDRESAAPTQPEKENPVATS